jgi:2-polyprenyl-3-methyl-5-hydroxy-6-metoxy-1,4-benzoquinol methylase
MSLITDSYREQNRTMHATRTDYGAMGHRWASLVWQLHRDIGSKSILDYGCGRGTLAQAIQHHHGFEVDEYDPAIPEKDDAPGPADLVICTDVLEHIEPDCLSDVLDDIQRLARQGVFLTVATRPAVKTLPDGRNAHLIIEPAGWWLPKLMHRWDFLQINNMGDKEFVFVGKSHE